MKILVISGFLGAGKTTFIKQLALRTRREIAVLENEYGSVNVDGDILKNSLDSEKVDIWEMTEGCICCSMKGDFTASVLTIANAVDPEYLVIEPTGVGMLSSILQGLQQIEYDRITLLAPVTIVDGQSYYHYEQEYHALYRDQLSYAHTILLSKLEQADEYQKEGLKEALRLYNPTAQIVTEHYSAMPDEWWDSLMETGYDGKILKQTPDTAGTAFETMALEGVFLKEPEQLLLLLEQLIRGRYGNIIRAKGSLRAGEQSLMFDVADGTYSVIGTDGEMAGKVVFIGNYIRRQALRALFSSEKVRVKIRLRK